MQARPPEVQGMERPTQQARGKQCKGGDRLPLRKGHPRRGQSQKAWKRRISETCWVLGKLPEAPSRLKQIGRKRAPS